MATTSVTDMQAFLKEVSFASDWFIKPSISTGQNTKFLIAISNKFLAEMLGLSLATNNRKDEVSNALEYVQRIIDNGQFDANGLEQARGALALLTERLVYLEALHEASLDLNSSVEQLLRLAHSFLALQERYNTTILTDLQAVKQLTVAIKCIDMVWTHLREKRKLCAVIAKTAKEPLVLSIVQVDENGTERTMNIKLEELELYNGDQTTTGDDTEDDLSSDTTEEATGEMEEVVQQVADLSIEGSTEIEQVGDDETGQ